MSGTLDTLANFDGTNSSPEGDLLGINGTLYATAYDGGTNRYGTVFSYNLGSATWQPLYNFAGGTIDGGFPTAGLIDAGGTLYGSTQSGGPSDSGSLFSFDPATNEEHPLAFFNDANGARPGTELVNVNGTLYGTTQYGGSSVSGTVFAYNIAAGTLESLASFNGSNGAYPLSALIDVNGLLYGTTEDGGSHNEGTVFAYDIATGTIETLANFASTNGSLPAAGLVAAGGTLYGSTTSGGTSGAGTLFAYVVATGTLDTLASFTGSLGGGPAASLTDVNGTLYGTSANDGTAGEGSLFAYNIGSGMLETLHSFPSGSQGGMPLGDVIDINGTLYGTTSLGGTNSGGTLFSYVIACFAEGTCIAGPGGPVPVEQLAPGDCLLTASGRLAPIRWLGHRRVSLRRHPCPHDVMPVRVRAGAFAPHIPVRDLVLSPDHAIFAAGQLIPIRHLINGTSIVQEQREHVTYWHVELDRHDILFAEGLACESYLDTGNRNAFGGETTAQLHPDFVQHQTGQHHAEQVWATQGCAPILTDPAHPALRRAHTSLLAVAAHAA